MGIADTRGHGACGGFGGLRGGCGGALNIPGRKLVFIDACHSGGINNDRLVRGLMDRSTAVFTASKGDESSYENPDYSHGYFTFNTMQGVGGAADTAKSGSVMMNQLAAYVSERTAGTVAARLSRDQHPLFYVPDDFEDFVLAVTK